MKSVKEELNCLIEYELYIHVGQNLSRQISRSLMAQPSLTEYNKFFRYFC